MGRIKFKGTRPPGDWVYVQPETRLQMKGDDHKKLMKTVLAHRIYKKLPRATMAEVEQDVERQICSRLSSNECSREGPDDELRPVEENRVLTVSGVLKFSAAAMAWLAKGAEVVGMEQLKKRQAVCLNCPLNSRLKACSCSALYKTIDALVPAARSEPGLFICGACGCSTKVKTQMPLSMIASSDEGRDVKYPKLCWITTEREEACVSKP